MRGNDVTITDSTTLTDGATAWITTGTTTLNAGSSAINLDNLTNSLGAIAIGGTPLRMYSVPVVLIDGRPQLLIQVAQTTRELDQTTNSLNRILIAGIIVAIVISLFAGHFLSGRGLRPVERVTRAALEIGAARDFKSRVPYEGADDEVAKAARVGAERVVAQRLGGLAVAREIGRDHRVVAGEQGDDVAPRARAAGHAVDQHDDRSRARPAIGDLVTVEGGAPELHGLARLEPILPAESAAFHPNAEPARGTVCRSRSPRGEGPRPGFAIASHVPRGRDPPVICCARAEQPSMRKRSPSHRGAIPRRLRALLLALPLAAPLAGLPGPAWGSDAQELLYSTEGNRLRRYDLF